MGLYYATEEAAAPTTPSSGTGVLYPLSSDSAWYWKDDSGNVNKVLSSVSGVAAGALTFSGALTLSAAGTALSVTNNATIGGTLGVTGAITGGGASLFAGSGVGVNLIIRDTDTYSANVSGGTIFFQGKASGGTNSNLGFIAAHPNGVDQGYLSLVSRVAGGNAEGLRIGNGAANVVTALGAFTANAGLTVASGQTLTLGGGTLLATNAALTNGAAAQTATMTNGPTAGNPTKWVPVNDNGTTRYVPMW